MHLAKLISTTIMVVETSPNRYTTRVYVDGKISSVYKTLPLNLALELADAIAKNEDGRPIVKKDIQEPPSLAAQQVDHSVAKHDASCSR